MRSLNARVTLGAALVLAVFVMLSALALERAFRDSARSARQERLLAQIYLLMAAAEVDAQGNLTLAGGPSEPRLDQPGSGLYAIITDSAGTVVWRSRSTLSVDAPHGAPLAAGTQRFEEIGSRRRLLRRKLRSELGHRRGKLPLHVQRRRGSHAVPRAARGVSTQPVDLARRAGAAAARRAVGDPALGPESAAARGRRADPARAGKAGAHHAGTTPPRCSA